MLKRLLTLAALIFILLPFYLYAATISGKVTDKATGENLPGASVSVYDLSKSIDEPVTGAYVNKYGEFTIKNIKPGKYRLIANFMGYKQYKQDISIGKDENLAKNITLIEDVVGLEELVVTGVASRREKAVSDISVSRVDAEELQKSYNYQNLTQIMEGKVSGVQVQTTSGNVGGPLRFLMRGGGGLNGDGQPVIFVDGARITNVNLEPTYAGGQEVSTLADINPEDIAKIEVLKGPAGGALYGTSGSNGTIIITTKKGRGVRDYMNFNYKSNFGWNEVADKFDPNEILTAGNANNIFRRGYYNEQTINTTGKSGVFNYYFSYSNRSEDGIVLQNKYSRESVKGNIEIVPSKQVQMKFSGNYITGDNFRPQNDNNIFGWLYNTLIFTTPYQVVDSIALANLKNEINTRRFIGSASIDYMPDWLPGLRAHGHVGFDGSNVKNTEFLSPDYNYSILGNRGQKTIYQRNRDNINVDWNVSYTQNIFENLKSTSIAGAQLYSYAIDNFWITKEGFGTGKMDNLNSAGDFISSDDEIYNFREAGIYLQEDLSFRETYFLTLAVRNDYSSVLGVEAPNIFYPRISGAIRLDKYDFTPGFMNFLKLRFGYGESGQLPGLRAASALRWDGGTSGYGVGVDIYSIGNPGIEPERIQELEFGTEIEFFNKYGVDFTYYLQNADKSIVYVQNAPSTGMTHSTVPNNLGEIEVWGFETSFYANPIQSEDFDLNLNLIINYQNDKIIETGMEQPYIIGPGRQGWHEGYRRASFISYKVLGAEFNENGVYTGPEVSDEVMYIGNPVPEYTGSFSANIHLFKVFTVSGLFEWATNLSVYNYTHFAMINNGNDIEYNNLVEQVIGTDGPPALTPGTDEYINAAEKLAKLDRGYSSNFVEKADWLRFRELALRFNAYDWLEPYFGDVFSQFSIALSVRNLALWSNYGGLDPEVTYFGGSGTGRGADLFTLPNPRTYSFSINLGL